MKRRSSIRLKRNQQDTPEVDESFVQKKAKASERDEVVDMDSIPKIHLQRSSASDSSILPSQSDPDFVRKPLNKKMVSQSDSNITSSGTSNIVTRKTTLLVDGSSTPIKTQKSHLSAIEKQTELSRQKGTIWSMLLLPDANGIKEAISADPSVLEMRDAVNATPLLLLCLYHSKQHIEIFKEIVATPLGAARLVDCYGQGPYQGESCLHLAIVNQDLELANLLITLCPQLIHMTTSGLFFAREGKRYKNLDDVNAPDDVSAGRCYFGHSPLSFAVSTNNADMVQMLLEKGADIYFEDCEGNNAMHMAVICGNMSMFTLLENELKRQTDKLQMMDELKTTFDCNLSSPPTMQLTLQRQNSSRDVLVVEDKPALPFRKNNEGYNCFELAAAYGSTETFEALLDSLRIKQWSYGPVTCVVYPLKPLEDALMVMMDRHRLLLLTGSGRMRDLINRKWSTFALRLFNWRLIRFIACLFAFQLAVFIGPERSVYLTHQEDLGDFQPQRNSAQVQQCYDPLGVLRLMCEMFVLVAAGIKFSTEFDELLKYGLSAHFLRPRGALFCENILSMGACLSIFTIALCRLIVLGTGSVDFETVELLCVVIATLSLWSYCLWFMVGYKRTGPFVIMIFEIVIQDALPFVCIFAVFLGCFSTCFWLLDDDNAGGAKLMVHMQRCLAAILGAVNLEDYSGVGVESAEVSVLWGVRSSVELLLVGFYLTLVSIVLLNMLIAKMGDTYTHVTENADRKWLMEWARVVQSIEREMAPDELATQKYWVESGDGSEKFLQIEEYIEGFYR